MKMEKTTKSVAAAARKMQKLAVKAQVRVDKVTKLLDIDRAHMSQARWDKHVARIATAAEKANDALAALLAQADQL